MVKKISIGPLTVPGLKIGKGSLLTLQLPWPLPKLTIPPFDIKFWDAFTLLPEITIFDPEWVLDILGGAAEWIGNIAMGVVEGMIPWIIESVFKAVEPYLDGLAGDFYERHSEEET